MASVTQVVRAEARRRWASWLALACLVALVGGTVLTGAAAARRTDAAFPDYLARYGYDAMAYTTEPSLLGEVARMPHVRELVRAPVYVNASAIAGGQVVPGNPTIVTSLTPVMATRVAKLASGRLPRRADEVDVGYTLQQQYHLHVGSTVVVPFYARWQRQIVIRSTGTPPAHGPKVSFTVVGVMASAIDFPSATPNYSIYVGRQFADSIGRRVVTVAIGFVRLEHGAADLPRFAFEFNHYVVPAHGAGFAGIQPTDDGIAAIESSIHPQTMGWWLFALLAGLAGLALIAQALSRQSVVVRGANPTLSALGMRPSQLLAVGVARAAAIGLAGAAGALALATALSPLTPVGEARVAEPTTGVVVDPVVFGLGGLAVVLAVVLLGAWPAWRDAQVFRLRRREERLVGSGASRMAAAAARCGAPATAVVGIRHALERGRGRTSVPIATALAGTVAAVGALVATSVFGTSMGTLLATPRLYGQDFQVVLSSLPYEGVHTIAEHLASNPAVEGISYAQSGKLISVNGVTVNASLASSAKGPLVLSLAAGRDPTGLHELALGTQTMRAAHTSIGSVVRVVVIGPTGRQATGQFKVVGAMVFPPSISNGGGLGVGAVVPITAAIDFVCGPDAHAAACRQSIRQKIYSRGNTSWGMAIRVVPGAAGARLVRAIDERYQSSEVVLAVPTNLVNFGQAVSFPLLLGVTVAIFGAATLAHLLFASSSRRRREFALLKVLGFRRRQVRSTVAWQATTVGVVGIVVGVPIGLAVGNLVWQWYATNQGAVPLTVVSAPLVVAISLGVLTAGLLLAFAPALLASRTRPAEALREE